MKYIFFLAILVSLIIIIFTPDTSTDSVMSTSKEVKRLPRLGTILTECQGVEQPKELNGKEYYNYCKCVKNPVDARDKEEKKVSCMDNLKNSN